MRKMMLLIVVLCIWFIPKNTNAQVSLNVNLNIGSQPAWGPVGYDYVEYYYLPDIDVYYNVPAKRFYYFQGNRWIYSHKLPTRYHYDFYNSYKVVINEKEPWHNHNNYKTRYASYKNRHDQILIRDSKDSKYFKNKNHPEHKNWIKKQGGNNKNFDNRGNKNSKHTNKKSK